MVCLHCPTPIPTLIPMKSTMATLGPIPMVVPMMILMQRINGDQLQNHHIGTNTSVKFGTVLICIGIGIGAGIRVGQWKHTITS